MRVVRWPTLATTRRLAVYRSGCRPGLNDMSCLVLCTCATSLSDTLWVSVESVGGTLAVRKRWVPSSLEPTDRIDTRSVVEL